MYYNHIALLYTLYQITYCILSPIYCDRKEDDVSTYTCLKAYNDSYMLNSLKKMKYNPGLPNTRNRLSEHIADFECLVILPILFAKPGCI